MQPTGAPAAARMTTAVATVGYDARPGPVLPVAGAPERRRVRARRARVRGLADPAAGKQPRLRGARLCGSRAWLARADREPLVGAAAARASAVASGAVAATGSRCLPPFVVAPHLTSRLPAQHPSPPPRPLAAQARDVISLALSRPPPPTLFPLLSLSSPLAAHRSCSPPPAQPGATGPRWPAPPHPQLSSPLPPPRHPCHLPWRRERRSSLPRRARPRSRQPPPPGMASTLGQPPPARPSARCGRHAAAGAWPPPAGAYCP